MAGEVTQLLGDMRAGDEAATQQLFALIYDELRRLARRHLRRERPDHTLQTTALVHEAYLKLIDQKAANWQNRAHFIGVASQLMRRILIDYARSHQRVKRGGGQRIIRLDEAVQLSDERFEEMLLIDASLQRLARIDPRQSRIVELRFFGGLTAEETAEVLKISAKTVQREWTMARVWLQRDLENANNAGTGTDQTPV